MKDQIKQAFEKVTGRDLDDYEWDLLLEGDDLGMDGLDFVEFIMYLESQLQISIPDDTAESLSTPNQWLAYLNSISKVAILKESTPSDHIADVGKMVTPSTEQEASDWKNKSGVLSCCRAENECHCRPEQESQEEKLIKLINLYWTFDDNQRHTHSWHDKQDCIEQIRTHFTITRNSQTNGK